MKTLFALCLASLVLSGCNTIAGIGKDMKQAGSSVENASGK